MGIARPALVMMTVLGAACEESGERPADAAVPLDLAAAADRAMPRDLPPISCAADGGTPGELACTGLYADWPSRTLAPGLRAFKPGFELWSDGASKRRWLYLPPGGRIDVSSMNEWVFPVGTKIW